MPKQKLQDHAQSRGRRHSDDRSAARDETGADRVAAVAQVEAELSRLLQDLLVKTQTATSRARGGHDRVVNYFGAQNGAV
jgi:hypothetical protein